MSYVEDFGGSTANIGMWKICFKADREIAELKAKHDAFLRGLLEIFNSHPDDRDETEQIDEAKRLINERGVEL